MTLYRKRVFADMVKDRKRQRLSWIIRVALNAIIRVLIRDGQSEMSHTEERLS